MELSGEKYATFDEKGRVVFPSDFKNGMGDAISGGQLAVEVDAYVKCLNIYPMEEWEKRIAGIKAKLNPDIKEHANFLDMFYRNFKIITIPENCRINIPNNILEKVKIKKEVVFVGQGSKIRLWDKETYEKHIEAMSESYENMYARLLGGAGTGGA